MAGLIKRGWCNYHKSDDLFFLHLLSLPLPLLFSERCLTNASSLFLNGAQFLLLSKYGAYGVPNAIGHFKCLCLPMCLPDMCVCVCVFLSFTPPVLCCCHWQSSRKIFLKSGLGRPWQAWQLRVEGNRKCFSFSFLVLWSMSGGAGSVIAKTEGICLHCRRSSSLKGYKRWKTNIYFCVCHGASSLTRFK